MNNAYNHQWEQKLKQRRKQRQAAIKRQAYARLKDARRLTNEQIFQLIPPQGLTRSQLGKRLGLIGCIGLDELLYRIEGGGYLVGESDSGHIAPVRIINPQTRRSTWVVADA